MLEIYVDELRNLFALLAAEMLLVMPSIERRNRFGLRLTLSIFVCCLFCTIYVVLFHFAFRYIGLISILWYFIIVVFSGVIIHACFKIGFTVSVWVMIAAYAAQHIVYVAIMEMVGYKLDFWLTLVIYVFACALIYLIFFRVFRKDISYLGNFYLKDNLKSRLIFSAFLILFIASTLINQANAVNSPDHQLNYLSAISDLMNCLFVLLAQFMGLTTSRINSQKKIAEALYEEEKKQYDAFKSSVDYINVKCHDLKHEIRRMRTEGVIDIKRLEEIENNIAIYSAFAKTGNETLDILLTEKNIACMTQNISLMYMADATGLSCMDKADIYNLFSNLLDNAIEYVSHIEDTEKRFIRLFVRPQGEMILIHQENCYLGDEKIKTDIPKTTKQDATLHGFGIKSMKRTAKKYGGNLKTTRGEGLFKVDILIQINK